MKRAKYQSLTLERKLEIIDEVDSLPPRNTKEDTVSKFLSRETFFPQIA